MEPPKKVQIIPELPYEIWNQILLRLPATTLIELRSVCKSWCELINSKNFQISHVHHQRIRVSTGTTTSPQLINLLPSRPVLYSLESVSDDSKLHCRPLRFHQLLPRCLLSGQTKPTVLHCFDGLFLVTLTNHLFLCNPITKSYLPIPFPEEANFINRRWTVIYDPSTRGYVIFYTTQSHVVCSLHVDLNGGCGRKIGTWRQLWSSENLTLIFPKTQFVSFIASISIDGKAHWLFNFRDNKILNTGILTIDVATGELVIKKCLFMPTPASFVNSNLEFYCLKESSSSREVIELWAVDDVDHNPTWLKNHEIIYKMDPKRMSLSYNFEGILKEGNRLILHLVYSNYSRNLLIYDISVKRWQIVDIVDSNGNVISSENYWITREFIMPIHYNSLISWNFN